MQAQSLADLVADRVQRRQGAHRLLEDDRDPPAANRAPLGAVLRQRGEVDELRPRFLGSLKKIDPPVILALAGRMPRMACEITVLPEPLSPTTASVRLGVHVERHAADRLDLALVGRERDAQIADRQQRLGHRPSPNSVPALSRALPAGDLHQRQKPVERGEGRCVHDR